MIIARHAESVVVKLYKHIIEKEYNITCDNFFYVFVFSRETCQRQGVYCGNNAKNPE